MVLRAVELDGKPQNDVRFTFAAPVTAAREVNAQEQPLGAAHVQGGELVTSFTAYEPKTFALRIGAAPKKIAAPQFAAVKLPYQVSVATYDHQPAAGCFDCSYDRPTQPQGKALPAEMLPEKIDYAGVTFTLAPSTKADAVIAEGQQIKLPAGKYNRLYLLAAASNGDHKADFKVGDKTASLNVQEWTGFVGQWDDRIWKEVIENPSEIGPPTYNRHPRVDEYGEMIGLRPGFIKRADIGWYASHRHDDAARNEAYQYSYLFVYPIDIPAGATTLTLPHNHNIKILAATAVNQEQQAWPAQPLYDVLEGAETQNQTQTAMK